MQGLLKKFILYGAGLCAAFALLALLYAPYLPRLISEGYPQASWPPPGDFAAVAGAGEQAAPIPIDVTGAVFDRQGQQLFEERDGKALLIFQGGRLRFEHYAEGFDSGARFNSYSMVKSLIGALVLKAEAEGKIRSLQAPVGAYLPNLGDATLRGVSVKDFLFMRSGIAFEPDGAKAMGARKDIEATRINPFSPMARLHDSHQPNLSSFLSKSGNHVNLFMVFKDLWRFYKFRKQFRAYDCVQVSSKKGTVVLYFSEIMHAGPDNQSDKPRHFLSLNLARSTLSR